MPPNERGVVLLIPMVTDVVMDYVMDYATGFVRTAGETLKGFSRLAAEAVAFGNYF